MSTQRPIDDQIISSGVQDHTVRNDGAVISSGTGTTLSPQIISSSLGSDIVLNGTTYTIDKQLARSGEAEVFLVSNKNDQSVFKYYYSQYKPKDEIVTKLKGLKHPDIISLIDYGYHQDRFFEISEYAQGGTLQDIMPATSLSKIKEIVAETIEALNYCHSNGIIHRDIKPENIFYRTSDKKDIAIGDFGIASNVKEGEELVRTTTARTNLYAAPELFTNIQGKTTIEKSVDYYALGITLLHLWFGRNPFEDVDEFGIMRLKSEGRIFFPSDIDSEVEKLIKGLITVNPRERWEYDEVKRWLVGESVEVHYQTIHFEYKPYSFGLIDGQQMLANSPQELADLLEKYPDKGEGHLYRNTVAKWIQDVDPGLFNELMDIVEKEFPKDRTAGLAKAIYILDPEKPFSGFDGTRLPTQEEISTFFEQNFDQYITDLANPNAAFYVFLEARNYKTKADEYRDYFNKYNPELAINTLIFTLQGADKFVIDDYTIHQPEELIKVDSNTQANIIQQLSNINSKLSLWISGYADLQTTIDKWRTLQRHDESALRYALQQGFEFNGNVVHDKDDFAALFQTNLSSFFSAATNCAQNQNEVDYWLTNYANASLYQVVIDYIQTGSYSDSELCLMLKYVLREYRGIEPSVYQVIEKLLPKIRSQASEGSQALEAVVDIHQDSIEAYWEEDYKTQSVRFLDVLEKYLSFVENNNSTCPNLFAQVTLRLDGRIANGIRQDIGRIKDDEGKVKAYRADLHKITRRLEAINPHLHYIKRYGEEQVLVSKSLQEISQTIGREKQSKIAITQQMFDEKLVEHREKYEGEENVKYFWAMAFYIAVAIFSACALIYSLANPNKFPIFAVLFVVFCGLVVAFLRLSDNDMELNGRAGGVGCVGCGGYILLCSVLSIIPLIGAIGIAWYHYLKRNTDINSIALDQDEKTALSESLNNVHAHFAQKELVEALNETVRILLLDDQQFAKELTSGA